jgi:penicillin-binding protein 2
MRQPGQDGQFGDAEVLSRHPRREGFQTAINRVGTGRIAFAGAEYVAAGKTGTAQVIGIKQGEKYDAKRIAERFRDHSLFMAFAPVNDPKIALAVIVENGGFGAQAAAPIARKVFDAYLLPPDGAAATAEATVAAPPPAAGVEE